MLLIFSPHHPEGCLSPPFSWTRASKIWTTQYRKQYTKQRIIIDKSCLQQNVFLKTMEESWWIRYDVFKTRNFFFFFFWMEGLRFFSERHVKFPTSLNCHLACGYEICSPCWCRQWWQGKLCYFSTSHFSLHYQIIGFF